jgi:recombination endonuclease VII
LKLRNCTQCTKNGDGPKPVSEFCKGSGADGLQNMCRTHTREYNRAWAKANPEKNRAKGARFRKQNPKAYRVLSVRAGLKRNYGMTELQFAEMFERQSGTCAICPTKLISQLVDRVRNGHAPNEVARVDHCHKTGRVRGLLCFSCNAGLGKFRDDEKNLLAAVRYLRDTSSNRTPQPVQETSRVQHVTLKGERGPFRRDPDQIQAAVRRREELSPF